MKSATTIVLVLSAATAALKAPLPNNGATQQHLSRRHALSAALGTLPLFAAGAAHAGFSTTLSEDRRAVMDANRGNMLGGADAAWRAAAGRPTTLGDRAFPWLMFSLLGLFVGVPLARGASAAAEVRMLDAYLQETYGAEGAEDNSRRARAAREGGEPVADPGAPAEAAAAAEAAIRDRVDSDIARLVAEAGGRVP